MFISPCILLNFNCSFVCIFFTAQSVSSCQFFDSFFFSITISIVWYYRTIKIMPPSKKRGPYKKHLLFGSDAEVPKRTKNYWKARERSRNSSVSADHPSDDNNITESTAPDLQAVQDHHEIEMDSLEQSSLSSTMNDTVDEGNVSTNCIPENNIDERNEPDYGVPENEGNESDENYHNYNYYSFSNENSSDDSSGSEDEDNSERLAGDNDAHVYIGSPQHNNSDEQINDQDLNSTINSYKENIFDTYRNSSFVSIMWSLRWG
ncbi:Protein of unknown function [Cotesia congregata]|uniref:Uncharacterized protein n=1 Tax=Cotesia congregata TaxID=51543 RepID=A0A8J2MJ56_COTCN|nr:Protein of unknown function [Cotesia congregata]